MSIKSIAVIGGGAGAHMMAVDLTSRGYQVSLCEHPRFEERFKTTLTQKAVEAVGIGPVGTFSIHHVGTNIPDALEGAEWINIVMPANGHELFFRELLPNLKAGHKVVLWAGDFGSLRLRELLKKEGQEKEITIIETNTLPYGTRLVEPAKISLLLVAPRVMAAALPASRLKNVFEEFKEMFPCLYQGQNVLAVAFNNPNPIVHPPGALLNVGRIEFSGGDFYMYHEGITESVARVIREVYNESERVANGLGFNMVQYQDMEFRTTCTIMGVEFVAPFDTAGVIGSILGPTSVNDRYITEDLPFGLVPRSQLGTLLGVPTPVIDGIVSIGSVVCREDFWQTGRTLESLGLAGMSLEEVRDMLEA